MKQAILILCWGLMMSSFFFQEERYDDKALKDVRIALEPLFKKYEMQMHGSGGGFTEDVNQVYAALKIYKQVEVDEARRIYMEIADAILDTINKDTAIRPYLRNYPAGYELVKIDITFVDKKTYYPNREYVYYVSKVSNFLFFRSYDTQNNTLNDIHEEPFEETLQIIQKEKVGIL